MTNSSDELLTVKEQLKAITAERNSLHVALTDLRLKQIEERQNSADEKAADHETRIRTVEELATQTKTLTALVLGGGALSAINLVLFFVKP